MSTHSLPTQARATSDQQRFAAQTPAGIADIRIDYGPRDLLGRFFLRADTALHELGITLSFGTFDELVEANECNRDSWLPLIPTFDPANGLCDPERSYVLIGRNTRGQIVTAQATILFDWSATDFKTEAESMRLFYAHPESRTRPQESCTITAPSAASLTGRVAFLGGAWKHPSVRDQFLSTLTARVSRAYAYTRWRPDLTIAIVSERLIAKGHASRNGYRHIEAGVNLNNFELGPYSGGLAWITQDELLADLAAFMPDLAAGPTHPTSAVQKGGPAKTDPQQAARSAAVVSSVGYDRRPLSPQHRPSAVPAGITDIRIDYGPRDLLGRFFLTADTALHGLGISLSFGTFDELVETNRRNRDSWLPLVSTFDPSNGLCDPERSYVLIGRNAGGHIVTAMSTIVFDWTATDFKTEAESMRLFYASPETRARPQESCTITAPSAATLKGQVAFLGGGWWHPSVRGQLLGTLLSRVSRTYAYTRWRTDLTMAIMSKHLIVKGFAKRNGYRHTEFGVSLRNFVLGDYEGGITWMKTDELLVDLSEFMSELENSSRHGGITATA